LTAPAPSTVSPSAKTAAPARPYGGAVASMAPASSRVSVSAPETTETLLSKGNQLLGKESLTVQQAIEEASKRVGVDAGILTAFAYKESTFEAGAKASTSSAAGLFQFLKGTWKQVVGAYGDMYGVSQDASPLDPLAAAIMGAAFIKHEIYPSISKVVPNPTVTDLYLGHFMGPSAGAHWLKNYKDNPNALAYLDWPDAAASNQWVYYDKGGNPRTYAEIYSIFTGSMSAVEAAYDARAKVNTTTNSTSIKTTPSTATPVAPITGTAPAGTAQATGGPVGSDAPPKTLINTKAGIYAVNS